MGRERREHEHEVDERLPGHAAILEALQVIRVDHHRRDGGVEGERVHVLRHLARGTKPAACEPGAVIVVADASRLSRELSCQMALLAKFNQLGIECIDASSGRSLTDSDDPMMEALTQMQGVFAQLEKRTLVAKLKSGRDAKSRELGRRCEGRNRMYYDVDGSPGNDHGLMDKVKKLRRKPRGKKRMTWNQVSLKLFNLGYKNSNGEPIDRRSLAPKFREFIK